jgi:Crinkler effector protein N-terminal domain
VTTLQRFNLRPSIQALPTAHLRVTTEHTLFGIVIAFILAAKHTRSQTQFARVRRHRWRIHTAFAFLKGKGCMALPPMPTEHLPRMITLYCWILGVSLTACPVDIEDSETVADSLRVIATELLDQSQVSKLTLWMVSSFLQVATNPCPQLSCKVSVADQDNFNDEIFRRSLTSNPLRCTSIFSRHLNPLRVLSTKSLNSCLLVSAGDSTSRLLLTFHPLLPFSSSACGIDTHIQRSLL